MKKTTREFGECQTCKGMDHNSPSSFIQCPTCKGTRRMVVKITIEESDDMKEFIEKKLGWKLEEGKAQPAPFIPSIGQAIKGNIVGPDYCCTGCPCGKPRCLVAHC